MKQEIVGITGTLGAGKGAIVELLKKDYGFTHYSVRELPIAEIVSRGLPVNRETMTIVGNELRGAYGSNYIVQALLIKALNRGGNAVIESIRTIDEAYLMKQPGASLWAIDAPIETRYIRVKMRASETDKISFEKFVSDEEREMVNTDPSKQNVLAVMGMADVFFYNEGTLMSLHQQIREILS